MKANRLLSGYRYMVPFSGRSEDPDDHPGIADDACSLDALSDAGPQLTQCYYPYGANRGGAQSDLTERRYTGQYHETGLAGAEVLYYYNARWYDLSIGRFIQADTLVPTAGNPQAINRYAYVLDDSVKHTDPGGHWIETGLDIAGIAIDIADIRQNGLNWVNGVSLAVDVVFLVAPVATGGGLMVRAASHADDITDVARVADQTGNLANVARAADRAEDAAVPGKVLDAAASSVSGFRRFESLGSECLAEIRRAFGDQGRQMGRIPDALRGRRVTTIGRQGDTAVAGQLGDRVLDIDPWNIEANYEWLSEAVKRGDVFYLASPVGAGTLVSERRWGGISIYARELDTLLQAGYRRVGDYLLPSR